MRTAPILLGLIIAPAKKDLLGMDTHAQVKKLSTWFLFPQKFTECDHIYGIFHLVELDIFFSDRFFFSDITVAYIYRYGSVQQCNPCVSDIIANYTKTKGILSYTYCFSYLIFHIRKKSSMIFALHVSSACSYKINTRIGMDTIMIMKEKYK